MGATEKIAGFIVETGYGGIPRDAVEKAKRTALDCLGAALAGVVEPVSQTITGYVTKLGGPSQASVFGAGLKVSVQDAALANGVIAPLPGLRRLWCEDRPPQHQVTLDTFTAHKMEDHGIVEARKKVHLSFPDIPIWPGLADVGPDTEFVGNPVTIRTTDGRSYSARVDIPRGDPALPLTDNELLSKYRDCGRSQLRPDDIERSVGLVLGLEKVEDIGTLIATLRSPLRNA
jgi:2-methylcitrate dehydratase PrpD